MAVSLIYGANYSIAKMVMPEPIAPFGFILIRVVASTALFWVAHAFLFDEKIQKKDFPRLILCAVFGVWVNQLAFFKGLSLTSPINSSIIMTMSPIVVLISAAILLKETIRLRRVIGIVLGGAGACLLILRTGSQIEGVNMTGDLLILINASTYSIYLVLVKPLMLRYHALTVIKWVFLIGIPLVLPFGWTEAASVPWGTLQPDAWFSLGYVVVFTTFFAYFLNAWAMKAVSPTIVGYYIYLQPVIATIFSIIILNESLYLSQVLYSLLIFTGVYLVSSGKAKTSSS